MNLKADHVLHHQTPTTNQLFTSVSLAAVLRLRISFQVAIQDRFILCEYKWVIPGEQRGRGIRHRSGTSRKRLRTTVTFSSVQSLFSEEANATSIHGCSPQENHPTSGGNFFQPIFVVQPTKNILGSDPASGRQLMPLSFRSPVLVSHEDRECLVPSWSVVFPDCSGNPLPQNRPKMLLAQGDHVVQALTPDVPISRSQ